MRREALNQSRGFEKQIDPIRTQADWFVWRRVLQPPWIARKQPATYFHRQHGRTWIDGMRRVNSSYFEYAGLAHEPLTLAIPLSGRESLWPRMEDFLNRQTWPHDQTQLVLLDTSHSQQFGRTVRGWLLECDYPDVRYLQESVSRPGLADADRHRVDVQQQVRAAMVRIYSRLAREVTTNYVWILEDDVLPPLDACQRLLEGFDPETASVSAVYDSRYDGQPCVWNERIRHYEQRGIGVEQVHGNGFGCVVLRGEMFRQAIFSENEDFDRSFYRSVKSAGLHAKVDWNCQAEHGELKKSTGVPRQGK